MSRYHKESKNQHDDKRVVEHLNDDVETMNS